LVATLGGVDASILSFSEFALGAGGYAAAIAVGAFLGQVVPGFTGASETKLRHDTVVGGMGGFVVASVILLSAIRW
jgi:hypothetical protein